MGRRHAASEPDGGRSPAGAVRIARLKLEGDADRVRSRLGGRNLPITVRPGPPAVTAVVLAGAAGTIVVGAAGA
jgi:hypothetical protein